MDKAQIKNFRCPSYYTGDAFTLVEVLIVVAILGILAAVVVPEYQNYTQKAKESAAKENLQILRTAIGRYAVQHNDVAPGYPGDNPSANPSLHSFTVQLVDGGYISERPENPFSNLISIKLVNNEGDLPASPDTPEIYGWIYKPATKEIRLNWNGTDSQGVAYYNY